MKKIIIITSNSLRHTAFRVFLSNYKGIKVLQTISEKGKNKIKGAIKKKGKNYLSAAQKEHLLNREQVEKDFFKLYLKKTKDNSKNFYKNYGYSSSKNFLNNIKKLNPDLIVVYGSSLIKGDILKYFRNKILNVHLGLSPYYKGSGTNYFALVNNKPELVGATFMFLDNTIDGGKIIHQIRPKIYKNDTVHTIGTRLISEMFHKYSKIIINFNKIKKKNNFNPKKIKFFKRKDFTSASLKKLNYNFNNNMIKKYLKNKKIRDNKFVIIKQSWMK